MKWWVQSPLRFLMPSFRATISAPPILVHPSIAIDESFDPVFPTNDSLPYFDSTISPAYTQPATHALAIREPQSVPAALPTDAWI